MRNLTPTIRKFLVWGKKPIKNITIAFRHIAGRNNLGYIVWWGKSKFFNKQRYKLLSSFIFKSYWDIIFIIIRFEFDPMRSAWVAVILNKMLGLHYILAARQMVLGTQIVLELRRINFILPLYILLKNLKIGSMCYGLELKINNFAQYMRAAGTSAQVIRHTINFVQLKLPSGEIRLFKSALKANLGIVSNKDKFLSRLTKASQNRYLGFKSIVRGVAKNPIDHPHGGGQGHTSPPVAARTPWGKFTKDLRTSTSTSEKFVIKTRRGIWLSKIRRRKRKKYINI
jgi:large subunit ribosomal protein L2